MWTTRPASKKVNGLALSSTGSGPRLLLIHGVGLRSESWNGLVNHLSDCYECIMVDLPGHGLSEDTETSIADIAALTDFLQNTIEKPDFIVGHSLGALMTLDWAARYPAALKGVAALNTIFERSENQRNAVMKRADALQTATKIDPVATLARWFGDKDTPERAACQQWLISNRIDQYAWAYGIFARSYGANRAGLTKMNMPTLFITGANEPNSTPQMSREMAKIAPTGHSYIVEGAAHMAPMTHAAEIAAEIKGFFKAYQ